MPSAAYKYVSDNGTTYQVVLPSDFATALGYAAAAGTEAYLPVYIAPRYATYVSAASQIQISVVITDRFTFSAPPPTVTVAGVNYSLAGAFGEKRTGLPLGQLITIAGPQGAQGPPGQDATFNYLYAEASQDTNLTANNAATILTLGTPAAGTWLFLSVTQYQLGTANARYTSTIFRNAGTTALFGVSVHKNLTNNEYSEVVTGGVAIMNGTDNVTLQALSNAAGTAVRYRPGTSNGRSTFIFGLQIA